MTGPGNRAAVCRRLSARVARTSPLCSAAMRRRRFPHHSLRFAASALATLGLLGHGLAMLFAAILVTAQPADAQSADLLAEICRSGSLAARGGQPQEAPVKVPGGDVKGCPVCNAFAQSGAAALPAVLVLDVTPPPSLHALPPARTGSPQVSRHGAQSRAPPLAS